MLSRMVVPYAIKPLISTTGCLAAQYTRGVRSQGEAVTPPSHLGRAQLPIRYAKNGGSSVGKKCPRSPLGSLDFLVAIISEWTGGPLCTFDHLVVAGFAVRNPIAA
jgi:hypothetical protein